jgi:hypothetical protein
MDEAAMYQDPEAESPTTAPGEEPSALLSRLRVIEDQPLETRAEALAQLHDELRAQLEAGDAARPHA